MTRRTTEPEINYVRAPQKSLYAKPPQAARPAPEVLKVDLERSEFVDPPTLPTTIGTPLESESTAEPAPPDTPLGAFGTKDELKALTDQYRAVRDGKCPLCRVTIGVNGSGMYGHISKCLRSQKSRTASTATT